MFWNQFFFLVVGSGLSVLWKFGFDSVPGVYNKGIEFSAVA
jgi:hypothetical protein